MSSSGCGSAVTGRRVFVAVSLAAVLAVAAVAQAQTSNPAKPGQAQQVQDRQPGQDVSAQKPAVDPRFVGSGNRGMILVFIKPDKTADFEAVMTKIKEAIAMPDKADDPNATADAAKAAAELKTRRAQWRKQAEGWSVLKVAEPMGGNVTYIWNLDPAVDGASYNPTDILYDILPREEADVFYGKLAGALANLTKWTITKLVDMKAGG